MVYSGVKKGEKGETAHCLCERSNERKRKGDATPCGVCRRGMLWTVPASPVQKSKREGGREGREERGRFPTPKSIVVAQYFGKKEKGKGRNSVRTLQEEKENTQNNETTEGRRKVLPLPEKTEVEGEGKRNSTLSTTREGRREKFKP